MDNLQCSMPGDRRAERRVSRRRFLTGCAGVMAGAVVAPRLARSAATTYKLTLGEWSFHRALRGGKMDNFEFPKVARDLGFEGVDFVSTFFKDKVASADYLAGLRKRMNDAGVRGVVILIDSEGEIGAPDAARRAQAIDNHKRWVDAAKTLGCFGIRLNAESEGSPAEQRAHCADGIRRLTQYAASVDMDILVENHGGLSSDAEWLAALVEAVGHPRCGTLPDFGNWDLGGGRRYDAYKGVERLMPRAKLVSVKAHAFDASGNETHVDYARMLKIVRASGYTGWLEIEFEGERPGEAEGVKAAKALVERTLATL